MSTPIRQLVKKTLSPRLFKSPNTSLRNTPLLTSDIQISKSPCRIKSLQFSESVKLQSDLEICKSNSPNSSNLNNRYDEFVIRKPSKSKKQSIEESQNNSDVSHSLLHVPNHKDVPSVNTPEREDFLKSDLSKLNLNVLGRGTFGTVVQAIYKDTDVALKIIRNKNTSLIFEANALNLHHPNILHVLLVVNGTSANHHLVIMQNCCAPDLQRLLDSMENEIPFTIYSKWIMDICAALLYCHQHGILHLDVKPKNILMKNDICILCDFGNSLDLNNREQTEYYLRKMSDVSRGGTAAYSAPELLHGTELPTTAADVYALAVTMCHIQTRVPPFHHLDNVHSVIYQVVKHNLRPVIPQILNDLCDCASGYRSLYIRCWAQAPLHRPSLSTVVDCLQNIIRYHDCCASLLSNDIVKIILSYQASDFLSMSRDKLS